MLFFDVGAMMAADARLAMHITETEAKFILITPSNCLYNDLQFYQILAPALVRLLVFHDNQTLCSYGCLKEGK